MLAHFEGSQSFMSPHFVGSQAPAAAGFAFALLAQQLLLPAAAGFAFALLAHFDGLQFAGPDLEAAHCEAVALALTFSVLLQPITAKPSTATRVRVRSCFIVIFSKRGVRGL